MSPVTSRIQHRRGTTAQWVAANPILRAGEFGIEIAAGRLKIKVGDGVSVWVNTPYIDAFSIPIWDMDIPGGVALLGADGKIKPANLPSAVAQTLPPFSYTSGVVAGSFRNATGTLTSPAVTGDGVKRFRICGHFGRLVNVDAMTADIFTVSINQNVNGPFNKLVNQVFIALTDPMTIYNAPATGASICYDVPPVGQITYSLVKGSHPLNGPTGDIADLASVSAPSWLSVEQVS